MANIVTIKRSSVAGKQPNVSDLQVGELALNLADGIIYSKNTVGNVIVVGSSTTSNIREGANLYFTNTRSIGSLTAGAGISIAANGLLTIASVSSDVSYNEIINRPANVISFNNALISYYETYNILSINKNIYRSGEVRYNITDDNTSSYTSVSHNFIHGNNTLSYSNTLTSIGSQVHSSHMALHGDNIVLFLVSSNVYATNYFLASSDNYQQNVTANLKGYVSLIEV